MKLSELFKSIGSPFSYYPEFVHRFDISVNSCVLLCFIGWKTFEDEIGNWRHFSTDEITKATGLTGKEQATARKHLSDKGLLEDRYHRLEHKLLFRLAGTDVDSQWPKVGNGHSTNQQMGNLQKGESLDSTNQQMAILQKGESIKGQVTKQVTTNELPFVESTKVKREIPIPPVLFNAKFVEAWAQWLECRRERKKPVSSAAAKLQLDKMARWGVDKAIDAIKQSIENDWTGIFEPKTYGKTYQQNRNVGFVEHQTPTGQSKADRVLARRREEAEAQALRDSVATQVAGS